MRWTDADVQAFAMHLVTCPDCQHDAPCAVKDEHVSKLAQRLADEIDARIAEQVYRSVKILTHQR